MDLVFRRASKLPNYIGAFGAFHGLRLLWQVERNLPKRSGVIKSYILANRSGPIYLREAVSDHAIFWQCIVQRQYDFQRFTQSTRLISAYRDLVKKGIAPLIIDAGGHIGLASFYLAQAFPQARIFAIEPDNDNFELLKKNTASFGDRITALIGGIWNESSALRITNPDAGSAAFRVGATTSGTAKSIRAYTVDEICTLAKVEFPLIVKLDIEGAQANLFRSNADWVGRTHLIMLELDDWLMPWQGTSRPFFSCVSRYPFDYLISGETIFCFRDFEAR
jgi:FkbM family methyltransferase